MPDEGAVSRALSALQPWVSALHGEFLDLNVTSGPAAEPGAFSENACFYF